jgi:hypothetical protein
MIIFLKIKILIRAGKSRISAYLRGKWGIVISGRDKGGGIWTPSIPCHRGQAILWWTRVH